MKNHIYLLYILFITVLFFSSCSDKTSSARLIPEDAPFVISIDIKEAFESSGLEDNDALKDKIKNAVKEGDLPQNIESKILGIIDNPQESGIDFSEPIYIAVLNDNFERSPFITGAIDDKDKFENLIKSSNNDIESYGSDISCLKIGGYSAILFNDNNFVWGTKRKHNEKIDDYVNSLASLFKNEKSFADSKRFKHMTDADGIIKMNSAFGERLNSPQIRSSIISSFKTPEAIRFINALENSEVQYSLTIDKGKASWEYELIANSDQAEKYINDVFKSFSKPSGNFNNCFSRNSVFIASTNFNGEIFTQFLNRLCNTDLMKPDQKKCFNELAEIISSFNGDITVSLDGDLIDYESYHETDSVCCPSDDFIDYESYHEIDNYYQDSVICSSREYHDKQMPSAKILAETKDDVFAKQILADNGNSNKNEWIENYNKYNRNTDQPYKSGVKCFGYKNKTTYFYTAENVFNPFSSVSNPIDSDDFTDNILYARFNFKSLLASEMGYQIKKEMDSTNYKKLKNILEGFDYAELKIESPYKTSLNLVMINANKTPIEFIIEQTFNIID